MSEVFQKFVQAREKSRVKRCHFIHNKTETRYEDTQNRAKKEAAKIKKHGRVTSLGFTPILQSYNGALLPRL